MKVLASLSLAATILATLANSAELRDGAGKLAIFQVVKFPNIPCEVTGGTKNGTCYTSEECSDRGGVSDGSCADGYGVCCICKYFIFPAQNWQLFLTIYS